MESWLPIATASISGLVTLMVCLINNSAARKSAEAKQNETINLITYKLETLTKKVEEHNNIVTRTYELEKNCSVFTEKLHDLERRVDDI